MIMLFKGIAHQAWLAGLGIVSKAQQEGSKLFELFIEEGARIEAQSESLGEVVPDRHKMAQATDPANLEKLENIFDERVWRSLQRLNVPTQEDMEAVCRQMEELNRNLRILTERTRQKT